MAELVYKLGCTIAVSTYQAGKLILLSAPDEEKLVQLPRTFPKPMGIAEDRELGLLALATRNNVVVFRNSPELASHYPSAQGVYDAMFLPRTTFHTGPLDIHDLRIGEAGQLYAVNTLFSCISKIDGNYNFTPYWVPPFIDRLASEDRCHLNGMAMREGRPAFASMFGQGNAPRSWTKTLMETGVIYDLTVNEPVAGGLPMPHSPRLFGDKLYVLLSGTGELACVDTASGKYDVVTRLDGFVRGMSICGDHLFVGLSKIRKKSSSFGKLDIASRANYAGVAIIHLPTGTTTGMIKYTASVDEIYDIHILEGLQRPNIMNTESDKHYRALMTPDATYWAREVPKQS